MNSAPDLLFPLKSEVKARKYAVVDIETKDGETQDKGFTRPFLVGFYDGLDFSHYKGPNCIEENLKVLLTHSYDGWYFYAHAGGSFDWLHYLHVIKRMGYYFEIITVASSIQLLHVKPYETSKKKGWMFVDSFKLIPVKLAKACKSFKVKSSKLDDHDLDMHEDDPQWLPYLKNDCMGLHEVLQRFHELVEIRLGGEVGITAAATSMKTFRRGFQRSSIQRHTEHHAFFRACYYGGRTEIFRKHGKRLHYYDINSAYPAAMREQMPVGDLIEYGKGMPPKALTKGRIGFAWARVDLPEDINIPPLPQVDERTKRLIFPVGKLKGYWTMVELERAQEMGATVHVDRSLWIEGREDFREFVDTLYSYRQKDAPDYDEGLDQTAKILLNSLYGKWGQAHERESIVFLRPGELPPPDSRAADPTDPDCAVWVVKKDVDAPYIIPQISAYITAQARLRLHSFLTEADRRGVLCYCDTDSILTSADMSDYCKSGLGWLKDEGAGDTFTGEFLLPKLYCLVNERTDELKIAMKGHRDKSAEAYQKVKLGETVSFKTLEKIASLARNQFMTGPTMKIIKRQLRSNDEKRVHLDNGRTKPLYVEQW